MRRPRTNTPLQSLVTLNDPAFVVAAGGLARRVVREGGRTPEQRLEYAFRCALARSPTKNEGQRLLALYRQSLAKFATDLVDAEKLLAIGIGKREGFAGSAEIAAWTVIANVLLNLDETVTKG